MLKLLSSNLLYCISRLLYLTEKAMNGDDDQMRSPAKSDTLRSTDSASGGETLEERSSKEVTTVRPVKRIFIIMCASFSCIASSNIITCNIQWFKM